MSRRNTKTPPRTSTLCTVIESLEPRAMLAGVGPESWSAPGLAPAPPGNGSLFSGGIILTCSSTSPGSSGTTSLPAPSSGSGGTTSGGDLWDSYSTGSGAGGSTAGSAGGVSKDGPALSSRYTGGSGAGKDSGTSSGSGGTTSVGDLWLAYSTGSGAGGSASGSAGGVSKDGTALSSQYTGGSGAGKGSGTSSGSGGTMSGSDLWDSYSTGSGAGGSTSGSTGGVSTDGPALSSQYNGGSGVGKGSGTSSGSGGTTSGGDLWDSYSTGSGAGGSTAGSAGGVSTDGPALSSQYNGGSGAGGQGNGTGCTLSNAELWRLYWSGAGAGSSSSSSDEGSLANNPPISAQYTGGSGIGRITPLVYNPQSDGPPVFHSGVWTGDEGGVQFVQTADTGSGQDGGDPPAGRPTWNDAQDDYYASRWLFEVEAGMGMYDPRKKEPKPADSDTTADAPSDQSAGASPNVDGISQTEELPVARAETKRFIINTTIDLAIALAFAKFFNSGRSGADSNNPLVDANFAQRTFKETFSAGGKFAGKTIDEVAELLRQGKLIPADLPLEYLTKNGQTVILNTRSAEALRRAGISRELWRGIDIAGDDAALQRLAEQLRRNKLGPMGTPTVTPSPGLH